MSNDAQKRAAGLEASLRVLALEAKGAPYSLGLGTGSTTAFFVEEIGRLFIAGLLPHLIACASTSTKTTEQARTLHLPLVDSDGPLTLSVDGADEIDPAQNMIKGGGGAMLRERVVALRAQRRIFIADPSKVSPKLGTLAKLPIEVAASAVEEERAWLREQGISNDVRAAFVTDRGNQIIDCDFRPRGIDDPKALAAMLDRRPNVKAHGLFLGLADEVIVTS